MNWLEILYILQNFWHREGLEYLFQLTFDVLPKQTCEIKHFNFTFNNGFMMSRKLNFNVTRNDFGHVLICCLVTLFLRVTYWGQLVEINFSSVNSDKLLNFVSFTACWSMTYIMKMNCSWRITILGNTFQIIK